ncbi:hypothetical protein A2631_03720 [Candidatus Daviesbacteria bacterium RIFCSPHIGHO2_01_FULL_44_29]|uniref:Cohesin domain-containing protein n=1 Tax=Candidatus Daviesbacteria bacterium RIFCSPHIGHO2_02_FULL_43_12 TaxID=1797776 RepID=A0A1F5KHP4_9BACT|nr:MAG: hypothetical protein A2631_03720 [Candidatus Daviesbacteria bacterium RIFCSPHIGHO2_01_FULL_44_29]OGE39819.1 MAG: hypothetical protein A3E86_04585 [Candidatus Daviesbacteria bacterium RIFCSPHIGHO2_12_FULL_47_45]OGE40467.1 MAG: hypothetical protein A3D25_00180 [Candidatus Daviesbacteria bacterium RIFCSPHIGHO2_02_FULL_43_12]OGE70018.1 MAG: hypothetical protein A3B55_04985 [Candidatus Daviesbacteria bacterium RIFCSPLOWO2_01_FULL_43_15]
MDNQPAGPIIIESSANTGNHSQFKRDFSSQLPKLLFFILAAVVAIEIVIGIRTLSKPLPPSTKIEVLKDAKLSLVTLKQDYKVGDYISVLVKLSSGGKDISGADVVLHFDPRLIEGSSSGLIAGSLFQEYPFKSLNPQTGIVQISGVTSSANKYYNGIGLFATVNLKARSAGKTSVTLDFKPGATNDSNIIAANATTDTLVEVTPVELTIN